MPVGPDQHGMVPWPGTGADPPGDLGGDPVRLFRSGGEGLQSDRTGGRVTSFRAKAFAHPDPDLQAVRVVEPNQSIGGVEDRRQGAVVAPQHDRPGAGVARLEVKDVVHRGAAERIDRLVVVAHDRDVPMRFGE